MKKNLIIFGTRPEAIKMAPLVKAFQAEGACFETKVCVTAQHREMLDQVLDFFDITPDFDLDLMKPNQNLYSLTADIITGLKPILEAFKPDFVFVHGDTTTTMASSIAAFYSGAKVCHVEAGLRTYDKWSPFPEEVNRQVTGRIADYHFTPTQKSYDNLVKEGVNTSQILITGNTVIDALLQSSDRVENIHHKEIEHLKQNLDLTKDIILVTGHRRENHGTGITNICKALVEIAKEFRHKQIVYPVHLNPNVKGPVYQLLSGIENIHLIDPLSYPAFVWIMKKSKLIITDSGGVQEEAPSLGKPVLVMRETTERPEAVEVGTAILVGTNTSKIVSRTKKILTNDALFKAIKNLDNPYGDGTACKQIVKFIKEVKDI